MYTESSSNQNYTDAEYDNILNCPSKWTEHPNLCNTTGFEIIETPYMLYNSKFLWSLCLYTAVVVFMKYII